MLIPLLHIVKCAPHPGVDYMPRTRQSAPHEENGKPCRACTDFKSWFKTQSDDVKNFEKECPLSRSELGRNTWSFLHTMAAYFPDKPNADQQKDMSEFFKVFSQFYPCPTCARDFARLINKEPPKTESRADLSQWLCWAHNQVNKRLGKPKFDCSKVDERWRYGWKDGSCDA